jgi:hypothetical protein
MRSCHHEQLIWQGVPRLQRGALSPTGSRHVVLRANFDSDLRFSVDHRRLHTTLFQNWWDMSGLVEYEQNTLTYLRTSLEQPLLTIICAMILEGNH